MSIALSCYLDAKCVAVVLRPPPSSLPPTPDPFTPSAAVLAGPAFCLPGPSVGIATQCLLRLQMAHPTYSEEQLMHCMSAHVADIKAEAAVKRSKS